MPKKLTELQKRGYLLPATINPTEKLYVCIPVPNEPSHIRAFLGQLDMLGNWETWDRDPDKRAKEVAKVWRDVTATVRLNLDDGASCAPELPETSGCVDYPLSSAFVNWYPLSPYTHGGEVPEGWTAAPFSFAGDGDILLGYLDGDVIVTGFPQPDSGDLTLPSIRFDLVGSGTIELHLLTVLNGGMAFITVDGDLLNSKTFDLNADAVSFPEESNALQLVYEVTLETSGAHTVEVRFAPVLDDTFIPIRYGGGIRSVVLCGFDEMSLDIRQNPEEPCILEKTSDGIEWVPFADVSKCVRSEKMPVWRVVDGVTQVSDNGVDYTDFPDGEEENFGEREPYPDGVPEGVDAACLAALNLVALVRKLVTDWINALGVSSVVVGAIIAILLIVGTGGIAAPLVLGLVSAITGLGSGGLSAAFTQDVYDELECFIYETIGADGKYSGSEFANLQALIGGSVGVAWPIIGGLFNLFGPTGLTNASTYFGITSCDHEPCEDDWYRLYDFTISPKPAHISLATVAPESTTDAARRFSKGTVGGEWVFGRGYCAVMNFTNFDGWSTIVDIRVPLPNAIAVKKIEMYFDWQKDASVNFGNVKVARIDIWKPDNTALSVPAETGGTIPNGSGVLTLTLGSPITVPAGSQIALRGVTEYVQTGAYHPAIGHFYIQKMRIYAS